jgi:hypothetical protein
MAKIRTVNVITIVCGIFNSVLSFTGDDDGKVEAEKYFGDLVHNDMIQTHETDDEVIEETIQASLDNGYYDNEDYEVIISWSDANESLTHS